MIEFRDATAKRLGWELLVHINEEGLRRGISPFDSGSSLHTHVMKTEALKQALDKHGFDAAFGGARRDEEKSRAKERVFSFRTATHTWDPKNQRPELWHVYNTRVHKGSRSGSSRCRTGPSSTCGSTSWPRSIPVVPLYFAKPAPGRAARRRADHGRRRSHAARSRRDPEMRLVRFRTLGCYPLTGAIESRGGHDRGIVTEMFTATTSERQGRVIDFDEKSSMEKKKREGYF
jgi:sulfate adenylyltransferase subunit 2